MSDHLWNGRQGIGAHPDSPAGGGGPGRFRDPGPLGWGQGAGHGFGDQNEAPPDATYVAGHSSQDIANRLKYGTGKGTASKKPMREELPGLFSKFLGMLRALDKRIELNATQSWGSVVYGTSLDGKGSIATKASKDAELWASVDLAALMEMMDLVLVAIPDNSDPRKTLESLREELAGKPPQWDKLAELVTESIKIVKEMDEGTKDVKKTSPLTAITTRRSCDPMFYFVLQEYISGDQNTKGGQISIYTDEYGTKRKIHHWVDKAGYVQYKIVETSYRRK